MATMTVQAPVATATPVVTQEVIQVVIQGTEVIPAMEIALEAKVIQVAMAAQIQVVRAVAV
jgi:hypothetical protein